MPFYPKQNAIQKIQFYVSMDDLHEDRFLKKRYTEIKKINTLTFTCISHLNVTCAAKLTESKFKLEVAFNSS